MTPMELELIRLHKLLVSLDPTTIEYRSVLDSIKVLTQLGVSLDVLGKADAPAPAAEPAPAPAPAAEPKPKRAAPKAEPKSAPSTSPGLPSTSPALGKETVRDKLTEASRLGIKIKPIMAAYVPEGKDPSFSNVPASAYPALYEEAQKAIDEKGAESDAE